MQKAIEQEWVSQLAEQLLCEILEQISGIQISRAQGGPIRFSTQPLGVVYAETRGEFTLLMWLEAEQSLFERLAAGMIGAPASDQEEVEEYATEFFNMVCGRFVSELYNLTGQSARFLPTIYRHHNDAAAMQTENRVYSVDFISDSNEGAVFSWTLTSQRAQ